MPHPQEIELKLEIPAERVARLERLALLRRAEPPKTLRSVYFDTGEHELQKNGLSLRVRQIDGRHIQTIKQSSGQGAGLFERGEYEHDVVGEEPDLDAAQETPLAPLLGKKLRHRLKPVFETEVRRIVCPINRNGSDIELTIDKGKVKAGTRAAPLCEVELGLKTGDPRELFRLARALDKTVAVNLATKSKDARGYALISGERPEPVKTAPIALTSQADWATAFKTVARACLRQIIANTAALREGDLEAVHQMRVGIRKLRAAISLFSDMLEGRQTKAIKSELKWLTAELGPARELDVFVNRVVMRAEAEGSDKTELRPVAKKFRDERSHALTKAETAAPSPRFRRLMLDLAAWIETGDWTRDDDEAKRKLRECPFVDAAAAELRRRARKLRKQGAHLAEIAARKRHKLRIQAKKLRYACEFFAGSLPGKKSSRRRERFISKLRKLQNALGDLNDILVHERLTRQTVRPPKGKRNGKHQQRSAIKAFAAGRLFGHEEARFAPAMKKAERAYARFAKVQPFWR